MLSENELKRHAAAYDRREATKKAQQTAARRDMSKDELVALAERAGMTVTAASGKGQPTKNDYLRAFGL